VMRTKAAGSEGYDGAAFDYTAYQFVDALAIAEDDSDPAMRRCAEAALVEMMAIALDEQAMANKMWHTELKDGETPDDVELDSPVFGSEGSWSFDSADSDLLAQKPAHLLPPPDAGAQWCGSVVAVPFPYTAHFAASKAAGGEAPFTLPVVAALTGAWEAYLAATNGGAGDEEVRGAAAGEATPARRFCRRHSARR
jgi:hypothetical protein